MKLKHIFLLVFSFLFCLNIKVSNPKSSNLLFTAEEHEKMDTMMKGFDKIEKDQQKIQQDLQIMRGENVSQGTDNNKVDTIDPLNNNEDEDKNSSIDGNDNNDNNHFTIAFALTTLILWGITIQYGKHCENKENNENFKKLQRITGIMGLVSGAFLFVKIIKYFSPHATF